LTVWIVTSSTSPSSPYWGISIQSPTRTIFKMGRHCEGSGVSFVVRGGYQVSLVLPGKVKYKHLFQNEPPETVLIMSFINGILGNHDCETLVGMALCARV
jgi:hypothetical protein